MTLNRNESQFSSNELNRILPSYLLEEIDKEHREMETQNIVKTVSNFLIYLIFSLKNIPNENKNMNNIFKNQQINCNLFKGNQEIEKKEDEKIINCNDNKNLYQYKFINKNLNNCNNILNKQSFNIFNNDTIIKNQTINSINNCNNIFVNLMNKDINNQQFCNYNNFSNDFNNNINYSCFNINNFNSNFSNNNLFPKKKGNNCISYHCNDNIINNINILNNFSSTNDVRINNVNIIQNNLIQNKMDFKNLKMKQKENQFILQEKKILLEDFIKYINNIQSPIIEFVCNSKGALELQKMLEKSGYDIKMYFIQLLRREGLTIIMKNVHGNYFFQKLIKDSTEAITSNIISYILEDIIDISKDDSGTFSVQALINEISAKNDIIKIVQIIKGHEIDMIYDKNATYVIQKIILKFPDIYRTELNEIILNNFSKLCLDVNGICIVKNFIKTNTIESNTQRMKIIISNNFVLLAQSPFGNYAIQFLIEKLKTCELNEIFGVLIDRIFKLSIQQFSSNVVEKALEKMDNINLEKALDKLFFQGKFIFLLKNKFGKFVIIKAMNYMGKDLRTKFEIDLINNINNGIYNHKDKNLIKKFLVKLHNKNFVNYNSNFGLYIDINCKNKNNF